MFWASLCPKHENKHLTVASCWFSLSLHSGMIITPFQLKEYNTWFKNTMYFFIPKITFKDIKKIAVSNVA